jgi:hypothetical protein
VSALWCGHEDHLVSRIFATDLPEDGRWPYFITATQLAALLAFIHGDVPRTDGVADTDLMQRRAEVAKSALVKPERKYTHGAKRLFWEVPEDTIMIRITNGERHALLAALDGVATEWILTSDEIQGLRPLFRRCLNTCSGRQ